MDENKLKAVFKEEAKSVRPGKVFCVKMRWRIFKKGVVLYLSRPAAQFKFATSFGLIIVMMSGGVSAYAYDSPQVNAASALYPVKQGLETIEQQFKFAPEDKIRFHIKIAKRRLSETEAMNERLNQMMPMMMDARRNDVDRLNNAIEQTMLRVQSEVDRSFEFTDCEMNTERARQLLRDMQDDFAVMRNHMGMMHDGDTLQQMHDRMEDHLSVMREAATRLEERAAQNGKRVRLREILIVQPVN